MNFSRPPVFMTNRYRVVLVGCGGMSRVWISAVQSHFADRVEFVGLVDVALEAALARAAEHKLEGVWTGTSLETALAELKPDVLFNCTIPEAHRSTCKMGLLAGCHVLVEKPLAQNVEEASDLLATSAATGRKLVVIQNRRYLPAGEAVRRALAEGVIGRVHSVFADFFLAPRFGGFRDAMEHPLLLDMAIHTFDQGRYLTGLDPVRATCQEFNPPGSWYAHAASALATFEMNGGGIFSYRGSWCAQGLPTSWQASWRIIGERGTLTWDGESSILVERVNGPHTGGEFFQPVERLTFEPLQLPESARSHAGNIGEFLDALDSGRDAQTTASDNIQSLAMVEAAIASAQSGSPVSINQLFSTKSH